MNVPMAVMAVYGIDEDPRSVISLHAISLFEDPASPASRRFAA